MAKYELKGNPEYAAQVIEVTTLVQYETLDNLLGVPVNGMTALVPKSTRVGDVLLAIPAGAQMSEEFARSHNLMRDQGGYIEDNRRVKAIRLRGVPSNILTVPAPTGVSVGTLFDTVDGKPICWKYEVPVKAPSNSQKTQAKVWKRADVKYLPEHVDTSSWYRNKDTLPEQAVYTVTQKLHGTSIRLANTIVKRKLRWYEKVLKKFGVNVPETEYDFVAGSRRVIKDPKSTTQNHWYGDDIWTRKALEYKDQIPAGFVVYGELVGWVSPDKPIQKNYTYCLPEGQSELYVYRVSTVTPDGILVDLSWPAVRRFCLEHGLKHVPEMATFTSKEDVQQVADPIQDAMNLKFASDPAGWVDAPVLLGPGSPCDEGLVIRVDSDRQILPEFYKAKTQQFLEHESKMLDNDEEVLS